MHDSNRKNTRRKCGRCKTLCPLPQWAGLGSPFDNPIKKDSHLRILYGNLAADGAVAKITGKEGLKFSGTAIVYESEETACVAYSMER